jgi:hypothetical protein
MLVLKKDMVYTLSDRLLGWYDDGTWVPSQVLVGCALSDDVLTSIYACVFNQGVISSLGRIVAEYRRDDQGRIVSLGIKT